MSDWKKGDDLLQAISDTFERINKIFSESIEQEYKKSLKMKVTVEELNKRKEEWAKANQNGQQQP